MDNYGIFSAYLCYIFWGCSRPAVQGSQPNPSGKPVELEWRVSGGSVENDIYYTGVIQGVSIGDLYRIYS